MRPAHGTSTRGMLTISHGQDCLIAAARPGVIQSHDLHQGGATDKEISVPVLFQRSVAAPRHFPSERTGAATSLAKAD
jgi:hypothetical protein